MNFGEIHSKWQYKQFALQISKKKTDAETHIELIEAAVDNRRASLQQLGVRFGASRATIQKELASEGYH